ncbi:MAG: transglycosylase domain-containing protein [bacterium]
MSTRYSRSVGHRSLVRGKRSHKAVLWKKVLRILGISFGVLLLVLVLGGGALAAYVSRDLPSVDNLDARMARTTTKIFDRTGKHLLYESGDVKRQKADLADIPKDMQLATIAIEDHEFYQHAGFSFRGIARSFAGMLQGKNEGGGSTITQQLIKNTLLSPEKTFTRKLKEVLLAVQVEQKFRDLEKKKGMTAKDQVLENYLNVIPYGGMVYGIGTAADFFLGKDVSKLTLAESAFLAALPAAPTYYSPFKENLEEISYDELATSSLAKKVEKGNATITVVPAWKNRQAKVLFDMAKYGYITKDKAIQALKDPIKLVASASVAKLAPHFVDYVEQELINILSQQLNYDESYIEQNGLTVITSLDWDKQQIAEDVFKANRQRMIDHDASNASLVAMDPKKGEILAMLGSYDYLDTKIDGQVNVAVRDRQPGSAMKPLVYTYAFEKGYSPATMLADVKTTFAVNPPYTPQNYDKKFHGPMMLREALDNSYNIPPVKMIQMLGVGNTIDFFHKVGITTLENVDRYGPAVALGSGETKLLDMTYAFATLANQGKMVGKKAYIDPSNTIRNYRQSDPVAVLRIDDQSGKSIYEYRPDAGKQVVSQGAAFLIWDVLSDYKARTPMFGANNVLNLAIRKAAAKTGTTTDYKDVTTFGYTSNLVVGVWAGNNDGSSMQQFSGIEGTAPIWNQFMTKALQKMPDETYPFPDGEVEKATVCKTTGLKPGECPTVQDYFMKGKAPKEVDTYWKRILVDKATGKRAAEGCPAESVEEKFFLMSLKAEKNEWQKPVDDWLAGLDATAKPPAEDDVACTPAGADQSGISIVFLEPKPGQVYDITSVTANISITARNKIAAVNFYLDGELITTLPGKKDKLETDPFVTETFTTPLRNLKNGSHTLVVKVLDALGGSSSVSSAFSLGQQGALTIVEPKNKAVLTSNSGTISVQLGDLTDPQRTVQYSIDSGDWVPMKGSGTFTDKFTALAEGAHTLTVQVVGSGTAVLATDSVTFTVTTKKTTVSLKASAKADRTVILQASVSGGVATVKTVVLMEGTSDTAISTSLATLSGNGGASYSTTWKAPRDGTYYFLVVATDKSGNEISSNVVSVDVVGTAASAATIVP